MEQLSFNTLRLREHDPREKKGKWRSRNKLRQQCLVRPVEKFFASTAPASSVGPVIGKNVITTARILQQRPSQGLALADDPESATVTLTKASFIQTNGPKSPTLGVFCRCNTAQCGAGPNHTTESRSRPLQQVRSLCFE